MRSTRPLTDYKLVGSDQQNLIQEVGHCEGCIFQDMTHRKIAEKIVGFLMSPLVAAANDPISRLSNLLHVQSERLTAIESELDRQRAEVRNQSTSTALLAGAMTVRSLRINLKNRYKSSYEPAKTKDIDTYFEKLRTLCPNSFNVRKRLFENGKASYYTLAK